MSADVAYTPRSLLAAVLGSLQGVILQQSPPALPAGAFQEPWVSALPSFWEVRGLVTHRGRAGASLVTAH